MTPYYADEAVTVWHGDALDVLRTLPDCSVDAVVTDPPYGLEFMGREWDAPWKHGFAETGYSDAERLPRPNHGSTRNPMCGACRKHRRGTDRCVCVRPDYDETPADSSRLYGRWCQTWAAECLRILKPGAHLLAFGGTRTVHRLTCAIEDAGAEVRDSIMWIYGQGFPKSHNLTGAWSGWGTALKPAHEPIVVARKPLAGTVAGNVLEWGTGALNIDGCRVPMSDRDRTTIDGMGGYGVAGWDASGRRNALNAARDGSLAVSPGASAHAAGRWPTNVTMDEYAAAELDRDSGVLTSGANPTRRGSDKFRDAYGEFTGQEECTPARGADTGGASRFFPLFRYEPKAPTSERPRDGAAAHPTVKPLDLMRWLVRLVTPPGGTVLDPFAGSGTTAEACIVEGFRCITVEREAAYLPLIVARLTKPIQPTLAGVA